MEFKSLIGKSMDRNYFEENSMIRKLFDHISDAVYFIDNRGTI